MVEILCHGCGNYIRVENKDLIQAGRQQVINEIDKILERLRK